MGDHVTMGMGMGILAFVRGFIFGVFTIRISVALPVTGNATALRTLEMIIRTSSCGAKCHFVRVVTAIVVAVTNPNIGNAVVIDALEMVDGTFFDGTIEFILAVGTIRLSVTSSVGRNAESGHRGVTFTFELFAIAGILGAILLIGSVATIIIAIANMHGKDAMTIFTLKLSWLTSKWGAIFRFV